MTKQKNDKLKRPAGGRTKITPLRLDKYDLQLLDYFAEQYGASRADAVRLALRAFRLLLDATPDNVLYWNEFYETVNPDAKRIAFKTNATCVACGRELLPDGSCPNDDPSAHAEADIASIEIK